MVRPRRTRMSVEARREQLLTVGAELLAARGMSEVWVDEVAAAAGVSRALVYHYFPSKRDLFVAVIESQGEKLIEAARAPRQLEAGERLRVGVRGYFAFVAGHEAGYRAFHQGASSGDSEVRAAAEQCLDTHARHLVQGVQELLGGAADRPAVHLSARSCIDFIIRSGLQWLDDRETMTLDEVADLCVGTVRSSLAIAAGSADPTPAAAPPA